MPVVHGDAVRRDHRGNKYIHIYIYIYIYIYKSHTLVRHDLSHRDSRNDKKQS
jgi:hypothetical protein